eukprot:138228-Pyramimonas_sp.AAC.1
MCGIRWSMSGILPRGPISLGRRLLDGGSTFVTHYRLVVVVVVGHESWDNFVVLVTSQIVVPLSYVLEVEVVSQMALCHGLNMSRGNLGLPTNCAEDRAEVYGRVQHVVVVE